MKINKVWVVILGVACIMGLSGTATVFAASTPSLGMASSYGILASTYTNTVAGTAVYGDVGFNTGPAVVPGGLQIFYGLVPPYVTAGADQGAALSVLASELCTFTFAGGAIDLSTDITHGPVGVYTPGVYCSTGAMDVGGPLTLSGSGTYLFRTGGALTSTAGALITLSGASACDIFWTPTAATTLAANTTFKGIVISDAGITIGANSIWEGQALAYGGTVTTDTDSITVPTYVPATSTLNIIKTVVNNNGGTAVASNFTMNVVGTSVSTSSFAGSAVGVNVTLSAGSYVVTEPVVPAGYIVSGSVGCTGTILAGETKTCTITNDDVAPQLIVNKIVINDNGRTKVISDFALFIDGTNATSGVATTTTIGSHTISETVDTNYTSTIGGDCATNGTITLALGDVKTCTITNNDIAVPSGGGGGGGGSYYTPVPPLIDVLKVPSPLALPDGPGMVKYTYTLRNIGTVPVTNVTMVGDTCSPIVLISGDTSTDNKLDVSEVWVHACSTTLTKTHTNIVTARGQANGISVVDIANATVIVGVPVVHPLIHVTKVPNPLVLPVGGGKVSYVYNVTNPGIVALSNVRLSDDKCSFIEYVLGDANNNSILDITEKWAYICSTNLTKTTVNTITASGDANGLTAKDFAVATVIVSADIIPGLPNTGLPPSEGNTAWNIIVLVGIGAILVLSYTALRKQIA